MFRQILEALRSTNKLVEMIKDVGKMLDHGRWMFEKASEVLIRQVQWDAIAESLYTKDRGINKLEQQIREGIITYLSFGHKEDLSACLVLMNVVKDAERIGDYCKNIFEVGRFYQQEYRHPEFSSQLGDIHDGVLPLFTLTQRAFVQCDPKAARQVLADSGKLNPKCDLIIKQLLSIHGQLAPDEAVAYVLLARFYKRISSHLANISTTVVSSLPMIDYRQGQQQNKE